MYIYMKTMYALCGWWTANFRSILHADSFVATVYLARQEQNYALIHEGKCTLLFI